MNKVILSGNLCRAIELKKTQSGISVVSNCLAVAKDRKDENGNYGTDFINIVVWDKQADYLNQHAKKGDKVELVGRWNVRSYVNQYGKQTVNECVVESVSIVGSVDKKEEGPSVNDELPIADDLPY